MGSNCVPNLTEKLNCSGTSPGGSGPNGFDCGCDPEDVAFKNIVGYGKAKCTKPGKKSGKKSIWTLTCGKKPIHVNFCAPHASFCSIIFQIIMDKAKLTSKWAKSAVSNKSMIALNINLIHICPIIYKFFVITS